MIDLKIVLITLLVTVILESVAIGKMRKLKKVNDNINSFVFAFFYTAGITLTLSFVFLILCMPIVDNGDSAISGFLASYIYLPFILYFGGVISDKLSARIKGDLAISSLEQVDRLNISAIMITSLAIVITIMGFELKYILTLFAVLIGRILWFDTTKSDIKIFFKRLFEDITKPKLIAPLVISIAFIITAIIMNFSQSSEFIRSVGIGLYLSLYVSGAIGIYISIKEVKSSKKS